MLLWRFITGKASQLNEVGQVKVLSYLGEHSFEAEVLEGEIMVGDIAEMNSTSRPLEHRLSCPSQRSPGQPPYKFEPFSNTLKPLIPSL